MQKEWQKQTNNQQHKIKQHPATFNLITVSGKDHQWMLELLGERLVGKEIDDKAKVSVTP